MAKKKFWAWTKSKSAKQIFSICRWLHIYLSTALFSLLIVFCFTGILLNHPGWLSGKTEAGEKNISLPANLVESLAANDTPPVEEIRRYIEQETGLREPRKIDMDLELGEITFDYPLPAGYAFITVLTGDAEVIMDYETGNLWAVLNDLHKGRHTGPFWSWVIDLSAAFMIVFAITGLVILLQVGKRRIMGLILVMLGTAFPWLIYIALVPGIN